MSENYIVINGKKMELTKEQVKLLGIEVRNNPFKRCDQNKPYFTIACNDFVSENIDIRGVADNEFYKACNYFNDETFAKQVALHQLLYRKLLKFAYENGYEDTAPWDGSTTQYYINYKHDVCRFDVDDNYFVHNFGVYFSNENGAKRAIKEVVEPFVKEHPEFVW